MDLRQLVSIFCEIDDFCKEASYFSTDAIYTVEEW